LILARYIVKRDGKLLVYKKSDNEWLAGQLELPTFVIETEDEKFCQYEFCELLWGNEIGQLNSSITKYNIINRIFTFDKWEELTELSKKSFFWISLDAIKLLSSTCLKIMRYTPL